MKLDYYITKAQRILAEIGWMARGFRCKYCRRRCWELRFPNMNTPMCNTCYYSEDRPQ